MDRWRRGLRVAGSAGFTLFEVVVALVIVGVSVVGWMGAFGADLRALARSSEIVTASSLARERLATIQLLAADQLPIIPDSLASGPFPGTLSIYRWTTKARSVPGRNLVELTVRVTWMAGSREVATYLPTTPKFARSMREP